MQLTTLLLLASLAQQPATPTDPGIAALQTALATLTTELATSAQTVSTLQAQVTSLQSQLTTAQPLTAAFASPGFAPFTTSIVANPTLPVLLVYYQCPRPAAWQAGHVYAAAATMTDPAGNIYVTYAGGTSGTNAPIYTGTTFADGSAQWQFVYAAETTYACTSTPFGTFSMNGYNYLAPPVAASSISH